MNSSTSSGQPSKVIYYKVVGIIHLIDGRLVVYVPLKEINAYLPTTLFVQTHRSYLVAIDKIKSIEGNQLLIPENHLIPISKHIKEEVVKKEIDHRCHYS